MRLIVVRHGIAIPKRRWEGADGDRPLTDHGVRQARLVADRLVRYQPLEIISSPSLRCRQTVEPLAARTATKAKTSERLRLDAGSRAVKLIHQLLATRPGESTIVLCTHREVLVDALPALAAEFELQLGHRPPGAKGSYWTLRSRGDRLVSSKYTRLRA